MIKSASVEELKQWLENDEAVLVDVRESSEYARGHIEGAVLVPLATVSAENIPSFEGKKLVMQCHSGGRSRTACGMLTKEISDLDVYNLEGGIVEWMQVGYNVTI